MDVKSNIKRPSGTDGSDYSFRHSVDNKFTRLAQLKKRVRQVFYIVHVPVFLFSLVIFFNYKPLRILPIPTYYGKFPHELAFFMSQFCTFSAGIMAVDWNIKFFSKLYFHFSNLSLLFFCSYLVLISRAHISIFKKSPFFILYSLAILNSLVAGYFGNKLKNIWDAAHTRAQSHSKIDIQNHKKDT